MRYQVVATIAALMVPPLAYGGSVQCTCPDIDADGVGNSSCSASEADNRCTVDFNEFDFDLETSAFKFLQDSTGGAVNDLTVEQISIFETALNPDNAQGLPSEALVDVLFTYALVAFLQTDYFQSQNGFDWDFSNIHGQSRENAPAVQEAFLGRGSVGEPGSELFITHGCIEIRPDNYIWIMYKALWSKSALLERCTE